MRDLNKCCMMSLNHGGNIYYYLRKAPLPVSGSIVVPLCNNCLTNLSGGAFRNNYTEITKDEAIACRVLED